MPLIRVRKAANIFGVHTDTIYENVNKGVYPPGVVIRVGRTILFDEEKLRDWLAKGATMSEQKQEAQEAA